MALSIERQQRLERFEARLAAADARYEEDKRSIKRDKDGKIIMPPSAPRTLLQEASANVEPISASDS